MRPDSPDDPATARSPFRGIYERCWRQDPARRPDMKEVVARLDALSPRGSRGSGNNSGISTRRRGSSSIRV